VDERRVSADRPERYTPVSTSRLDAVTVPLMVDQYQGADV